MWEKSGLLLFRFPASQKYDGVPTLKRMKKIRVYRIVIENHAQFISGSPRM